MRLESIKERVGRDRPKSILLCRAYGISVLVSIALTIILFTAYPEASETALGVTIICWYGFGIPIWTVWKIILFIKSKSKNHYLYIKDV